MHFVEPKRFVNRIFIHSSASNNPEHNDISVIRDWHLAKDPPWDDVGYHGFITTDGRFQVGRSIEKQPAGQYPHNKGTLAICCHGLHISDFTDEQFETLLKYCTEANKAYAGKVTFHGHCEVNPNKTCPVFDYAKVLNLDEEGHMMVAQEQDIRVIDLIHMIAAKNQEIRVIDLINGASIIAKISVAPGRLEDIADVVAGRGVIEPEGKFYHLEDAFILGNDEIFPLTGMLGSPSQIIDLADRNILISYVPAKEIIENYQNLLLNTVEAIPTEDA